MSHRKSTIHVGMVLEKGFPPDSRVEREARALVEAGYRVSLLCLQHSPTAAERETLNGVEIIRVSPPEARWQGKIPFLNIPYESGFFCHGLIKSLVKRRLGVERDWEAYIDRFLREEGIDILHVHDLRLLRTCLYAVKKQKRDIRVVSDLHEHYPALMAYTIEQTRGPKKARQKWAWWTKEERQCLPQVDHIIVVIEEAKERLQTIPGIPANKITVVRNVVDAEPYQQAHQEMAKPDLVSLHDRFVLCYVGYVNNTHRGIQTVLSALPKLIETIPNLLFVGVGRASQTYYESVLAPIIAEHQLEPYVHFTGYRREVEFLPYIEQAHIGLVPHVKTLLTDNTFPNKLFLYQMMGKPVVVSSCNPLVRYIDETNSGLVFQSEDPDSLAEQILTLHAHPELQAQLGQCGQQAVAHRYCWDIEKNHLLTVYPPRQSTASVSASHQPVEVLSALR